MNDRGGRGAAEAARGRTHRIHLLQWRVLPGRVDENLEAAEGLLADAAPSQGDIVLLPEMFPCGFFYSDLSGMADRADEVAQWMCGTAARLGTHLAGSLPRRAAAGVVNAMVLAGPDGRETASYAKVHLFPFAGEHLHFFPGDGPVLAQAGPWRVGLLVCFDLRFPEIARSLCLAGADLILVSAQWPLARAEHFRLFSRARAMENQLYLAAANSCGADASGVVMGGGSLVVGPLGEVLAELGEEEGAASAALDPGEVARAREAFPVLAARRPAAYGEPRR